MVTHCAPSKSGMVACKLSTKNASSELERLFGTSGPLVVVCDNSPEDCVVAGDLDNLTTFLRHCKDIGIKALQLQVPFGFHSPAVEPMTAPFRQLCSEIKMTQGTIPIISSHLGRAMRPKDLTADYLPNQTRHPVRFSDAIRSLESFTTGQKMRFLEIGHTTGSECSVNHAYVQILIATVTAMAKRSLGENDASYVSSLRPTESPWSTISTTLKALFLEGAPVKWAEIYAGSVAKYLDCTPHYPLFPTEFVVPFKEPSTDQSHCSILNLSSCSKLFFQLNQKPSSGQTTTTFEAGLSLMSGFITAHVVGGTPLCPASIYIEVALEAMAQLQPARREEVQVLTDISFESPLVYPSTQEDQGSLSLILDQQDPTKREPNYSFRAQRFGTSYCTGAAKIEPLPKIKTVLNRKSAFIRKHVDYMLKMDDAAGDSFSTRMIYDVVFPRVVSYSDPFLTLQRLRISPSGLEGYGSFRLPSALSSAKFICHPALVDTLLHTAGFIANNWISRDQACICVKVENISLLLDDISASMRGDLSIYCSMVDCIDGFVIGDAYAMDQSGNVIAMAEGMHFKKTALKAFQSYLARLAQGGQKETLTSTRRDTAKDTVVRAVSNLDAITQKAHNPDVIRMLRHEISQLCGTTSDIDADADLAQLGIDSLMFIELTQLLRRKVVNIDSSGLDLNRCSTLRDLENLLLSVDASSTSSDMVVDVNSILLPGPQKDLQPIAAVLSDPNTVASENSSFSIVKTLVEGICGCQIFNVDKDVSLESLGVDSLLSMELEQGLRQLCGISVDGDHDVISELTVGQLEILIVEKLGRSPSSITPQLSPSPVSTHAATKLQHGQDSGNKIYLFHDGSGLSHQYAKIGPLGCEVYGVPSLDFAGIDPLVRSLEEFASRYISLLELTMNSAQGVILGGRFPIFLLTFCKFANTLCRMVLRRSSCFRDCAPAPSPRKSCQRLDSP
jgi:iterative type I PKS product template protein